MSDLDPIRHYCLEGWWLGCNPSEHFDTQYYLSRYNDIRQQQMNPLLHYILRGAAEERDPVPDYPQLKQQKKIQEDIQFIRDSGCFDESYYKLLYPAFQEEDGDPISHYCRIGWREGKNPSEEFDTEFYLSTYPYVAESGFNPFAHYLQHRSSVYKRAKPSLLNSYEDSVRFGAFDLDIKAIAFYRQDERPAAHQLPERLLSREEEVAPLSEWISAPPTDSELLRRQAAMAAAHGISCFCFESKPASLLDPLPYAWHAFAQAKDIPFSFSLRVDCRAGSLDRWMVQAIAELMADPRYLRLAGRPVLLLSLPWEPHSASTLLWLADVRSHFRELLVEPFLMGCFEGQSAIPELRDGLLDGVVSATPPVVSQPLQKEGVAYVPYSALVSSAIHSLDQPGPSSLKSFPVVCLTRYGQQRQGEVHAAYTGFTLSLYRQWLDGAISHLRRQHPVYEKVLFLESWNHWADGQALEPDQVYGYARLNTTAKGLLGLKQEQALPLVSVIVPNYNHQRYLRRRLESIYQQTYQNYEVILLDDCSTDASREVLDEYANLHGDQTRCLYSTTNSGSVFRQWAKGIGAARGELIWIAESDDYCALNFLETLVASFNDESVLLAYCTSLFVDQHEHPLSFTLQSHVKEIPEPDRWLNPYVRTAHQEVCEALGIKNTIPNASSALFRRPVSMPLLENTDWLKMRIAGDWMFYLHLIRGGKVAYVTATTNYYRRHESSVASSASIQESFYREISAVQKTIARLYGVPLELHQHSLQVFEHLYRSCCEDDPIELFHSWFDYGAIQKARADRFPNILVSILGFYPGGAEIFPIRLANEFRRRGHAVTLLSLGQIPREYGVRKLLANDIPVVEASDPAEIRKLIDEFNIEVCNSHHWILQRYPFDLPDVYSRLKGHVATLHGMLENESAFRVTPEELVAADGSVSTWVYTTEKNLDLFKEMNIIQSSTSDFVKIPNGMEPPLIQPVARHSLGIPDEAFVLCCVSRAIPEKGWEEAMEVVSSARLLTSADIHLVFVGNGPVYDDLRSKDLPDYVHLVGFNGNSVGFYALADMGIMLSTFRSESFPLTILDCLFAGRPYLATDVGEIRPMLSDGDSVAGAVIPLQNWQVPIDLVVEVLSGFVADHGKYRRVKDLAVVLARRYSIDGIASQYLQLFQRDASRTREAQQAFQPDLK